MEKIKLHKKIIVIGIGLFLLFLFLVGRSKKTEIKIETTEEPITCGEAKVEYSDALFIGESMIAQECIEGTKRITYKIEYTNGNESSRELLSEDTIEPTNEVRIEGTKEKEEKQPNNLSNENSNQNKTQAPTGNSANKSGYCKDGTQAYGNPSAPGRANVCYGHGGWVK